MGSFAIIISVLDENRKKAEGGRLAVFLLLLKTEKGSQLGAEGNPNLASFPGSASSGKWLWGRNPKWQLPKLTG